MKPSNLRAIAIAFLFGTASTNVLALDVFIDFTGDAVADANHSVALGSVFTGSVYASLDDSNGGLVGFGAALNFDEPPLGVSSLPSKVANVVIDPQWSFVPARSAAIGNAKAGGSLDLFAIDIPFGPAVHLFDITFEALALGTSQLTWGLQETTPGFDNFVAFDGTVFDQTVNFVNAAVTVVPLPGTLPLLLSAFLGGGAVRRMMRPHAA